ncbi:MAG: hypothetical protein WA941_18490 [Nitrososphaeraceae archaeon]
MEDKIMRYRKDEKVPYRRKTFEGWIREWWKWASQLAEDEKPEDHPLNENDLKGEKLERSYLKEDDEPVVALGTEFDKIEGSQHVLRLWKNVPKNTAIVLPLICLNVDNEEAQHSGRQRQNQNIGVFKQDIARTFVENDSYAFAFCQIRSGSKAAAELLSKDNVDYLELSYDGITKLPKYHELAAFRHGKDHSGQELISNGDPDSKSAGHYTIFKGENFNKGDELNITICNGANFLGKSGTRFGTKATYQLLFV